MDEKLLLTLDDVQKILPFGKSTIRSWAAHGTYGFPSPIQLSARRNVWDRREIEAWVNEVIPKFKRVNKLPRRQRTTRRADANAK